MNDLFGSTLPVMRKPQKPTSLPPRKPRGTPRQLAVQTARNRMLFATVMFALVFSVLSFRLVEVSLLRSEPDRRMAALVRGDTPLFSRRDIVDRNGELLATNLSTASVYANPRELLSAADATRELHRVLPELSKARLQRALASDRSFVWIKRNITPSEQQAINALGIPGVYFEREEKRIYPHQSLAAHVLGFVGIDNNGLKGIEKALDRQLTESKKLNMPLQLSLDIRAQHAVHAELVKAMEEFQAIGAAGIVMDIHTGEVLSMVSLPDFDPNSPATARDDARFNRTTLGVYEMGSVFKTFTTAAALEMEKVSLTSGYDASKPLRLARHTIRDFHPENRWLSVPEIFMHSSNIGTVKMAMELGGETLKGFFADLGLTQPVNIELDETSTPLIPHPWGRIHTATASYGHGIAVSPLHVARSTAAIANGGVLTPVTLLKRAPDTTPKGERIIATRTSHTMRKLLRLVVTDGTAGKAAAQGWMVGGKTGTADKPSRTGGYSQDARITSFTGVFPMHAPRYVVLIMLDEPRSTRTTWGFATAGWNAAPVASRIIARLGTVLGVRPVDENSPEMQALMHVPIPSGSSGIPHKTVLHEEKPRGLEIAAY